MNCDRKMKLTEGAPSGFPAGTLILTDQGYLEIEKAKSGMKVLTHRGRWRKVTAVERAEAATLRLKGNHYGLECSGDLQVLSAEAKKHYHRQDGRSRLERFVSEEKELAPACGLAGRLWAVPSVFEPLPIPPGRHEGGGRLKALPPFGEGFFYLTGRWLGDGWVDDSGSGARRAGRVVICAGYQKEDELRRAVEAVVGRYHVERGKTCVKYKFSGRALCEWLTGNFGRYAYGKQLPAWALTLPEELRRALLKGICDTDGYRFGNACVITSVSKRLAHGIRLLGETLGCSSTIYRAKKAPTRVLLGRTVNQRDTYTAELTLSTARRRLTDGLHSWYRVKSAEPTGTIKPVYSLKVEEDNSFVAEGIVARGTAQPA